MARGMPQAGETKIPTEVISPDWPLCLIGKKHDKENALGYELKLFVNVRIGKTVWGRGIWM